MRVFTSFRAAILAALALSSCGQVDYNGTKPGEFQGSLFVMWLGGGGSSGDGAFLFVPDPDNRLSFDWPDENGKIHTIQPDMMYTDGGSIPKIGQVFNGLGPWGYAPAYMVHDWLYTARHCLRDGTPTPSEQKVADITFEQSAVILASAIKTLIETRRVKKNDFAPQVISGAVAGPIARNKWNEAGACAGLRILEKDRQAAEAGIPGSSTALRRGGTRPATVVGQFSF